MLEEDTTETFDMEEDEIFEEASTLYHNIVLWLQPNRMNVWLRCPHLDLQYDERVIDLSIELLKDCNSIDTDSVVEEHIGNIPVIWKYRFREMEIPDNDVDTSI